MKIKEIDNKIKKVFPHFNIGREKKPDKLYVDEVRKVWWITNSACELSEKTLGVALKEFFSEEEVQEKKYLGESNYQMTCDFKIDLKDATAFDVEKKKIVPVKSIIFEFDGEKHYNSAKHVQSDKVKMKELARLGYRRIRIPFYFQLTKDLTKFIFDGLMFHFTGKTYWNEKKWKNAVKKVYCNPFNNQEIKDEDFLIDVPFLLSPGMHSTEYYPRAFIEEGLERFVKDFNWKSERPYNDLPNHPDAKFPESAKHQIVKALELYVNDTNTGKGGEPDELILPSKTTQIGKELNLIYHKIKSSYNEKYLKQVFYCRKKYDDILPELKSLIALYNSEK